VTKKKKLSQTFPASSVKASANKSFIFNYSQYIAGSLLYPAAGSIVTLFIFDDMTKNVQIAVSSLPQSTVRSVRTPPPLFIIKTE
jgi:hypothetical protein